MMLWEEEQQAGWARHMEGERERHYEVGAEAGRIMVVFYCVITYTRAKPPQQFFRLLCQREVGFGGDKT
jgi:hypothetical protein